MVHRTHKCWKGMDASLSPQLDWFPGIEIAGEHLEEDKQGVSARVIGQGPPTTTSYSQSWTGKRGRNRSSALRWQDSVWGSGFYSRGFYKMTPVLVGAGGAADNQHVKTLTRTQSLTAVCGLKSVSGTGQWRKMILITWQNFSRKGEIVSILGCANHLVKKYVFIYFKRKCTLAH